MKKPLCSLLGFAATLMLTGCETWCSYEVRIINRIESDIVVEIPYLEKQITIEPNLRKVVDMDGYLCGGIHINDEKRVSMAPMTMTIDGVPVSNEIWRVEHWDYDLVGKFSVIYTLTVTEYLLQSLETAPEDTFPN